MLLDPGTGDFYITGSSFSNHSVEFYEQVIDFLERYVTEPLPVTVLNVKLTHRNSATDKCMIQVLESLAKVPAQRAKVIVKWYYPSDDDDDELEYAKSLAGSIDVAFEFIPY
ncbi:MAG: SiaC family regulatory phosphoprotein [Bacteroidota bacterium]